MGRATTLAHRMNWTENIYLFIYFSTLNTISFHEVRVWLTMRSCMICETNITIFNLGLKIVLLSHIMIHDMRA